MKTLIMSSVAAIFAASAAYAADVLVIIDTDNDGVVSVEEYRAASTSMPDYSDPMWSRWDADADDVLTREEFEAGIWTHYDSNDDGFIDGPELEAWDEDQLRYDATRSGREISPPG